MADARERWHLSHDGHEHVVEVEQGSLSRVVSWSRDEAGSDGDRRGRCRGAGAGGLAADAGAVAEVRRRRKAEEKKRNDED